MGQWVQVFFYVGLMFYGFLLPAAVFRCHFMAEVCCSVLQFVAVCCSVLQCAAVCCCVLQCVVWQCFYVFLTLKMCLLLSAVVRCHCLAEVCERGRETLCCVLQCVAVCCSVLQCGVCAPCCCFPLLLFCRGA